MNVIANYFGKGWTVLLNIALVPVYINLLGIESWGLVGFYVTLQGLLPLLDMGLKIALNRELSRLSARGTNSKATGPGAIGYAAIEIGAARNKIIENQAIENQAIENEDIGNEAAHLVRSLEIVYWSVSGLLALLLCVAAPMIAAHWFKTDHLSHETIRQAILLMGITISLQFPFDLYAGGLLGLNRQVQLNTVTIFTATLRGLGAIAVLKLLSPTIQTYFAWQALVATTQTGLCMLLLWRSMPPRRERPRFQKASLQNIWQFAVGITSIGAIAVTLMQIDSVVLSRTLSLTTFGYYTLAKGVAVNLSVLVLPMFDAVFPIFTRLVAGNNEIDLKMLYHRSCQLVAVIVMPITAMIVIFSYELLLLWTNSPAKVEHAYAIVRLLIVAQALSALCTLPFALQLANGWTRLSFLLNLGALSLFGPTLLVVAPRYGALGVATLSVVMYTGYLLVCIPCMHSRLLRSELGRWWLHDFLLPLCGTLAVGSVLALCKPRLFPDSPLPYPPLIRVQCAAELGIMTIGVMAAALLCVPDLRAWLLVKIVKRTKQATIPPEIVANVD